MAKRAKRAGRGQGSLFKRHGGKKYPPGATIRAAFYLKFTQDGKERTVALKDAEGNPIMDRKQAEAERDRLTAPIRTADEVRRAEAVASLVQTAEERAKQAQEALADAELVLPYPASWEAFLHEKKLEGRELAPRTEDSYLTYWREFTGWMTENHPHIRDVRHTGREHAKAFAAYLTDKGETGKTFNCKIGFLKSFFKILADPARLTGNPFDGVKPHPVKTKSKRVLTVDELKRLIDTAEGEYKTLFCIGTFTGLRLADCALLEWKEVDLDRGIITRTPIKTRNTSGKAVTIGVPAFLMAHLEQIPPGQRKGFVVPEIASCYTQDRARAVSKKIKRIFDAAGIERTRHDDKRAVAAYEEGFCSLRHTFVSLCAEKGAPMSVVQNIVGHTNAAMTAHYTHATEQAVLNTARLLELDAPQATELTREPLPAWAREIIEGLNGRNWKQARAELLNAV